MIRRDKSRVGERPLAKGQIWSLGAVEIEILGMGKEFIHYKVTSRLGRKRVSAQVSAIEPMENYLDFNDARLVQEDVGSGARRAKIRRASHRLHVQWFCAMRRASSRAISIACS
jgi:hypothetical protein